MTQTQSQPTALLAAADNAELREQFLTSLITAHPHGDIDLLDVCDLLAAGQAAPQAPVEPLMDEATAFAMKVAMEYERDDAQGSCAQIAATLRHEVLRLRALLAAPASLGEAKAVAFGDLLAQHFLRDEPCIELPSEKFGGGTYRVFEYRTFDSPVPSNKAYVNAVGEVRNGTAISNSKLLSHYDLLSHLKQALAAPIAPALPVAAETSKDAEIARLNEVINQPMNNDFLRGVSIEAEHQRQKWGDPHDRNKSAENWFWLVGYLAGKCLRACITGDRDKAQHHTISSAAALFNWHKAISSDETGSGIGADIDIKPRADGGHEGENALQSPAGGGV